MIDPLSTRLPLSTRPLRAALLALALAAVAAPATSVLAQPTDAAKEVARQRYEEGVKALDEGRFDDARAAFDQAFNLTGSPAVLLNLGLAESKTNRCADAGNHIHRFLREHKAATPANKTLAAATLEECKKKVGLLAISIDTPGADVTVDGKPIGKAPIEDPFFVEPGPHVVGASFNGKSTTSKADGVKGSTTAVRVSLNATTTPPPPPPPGGGTTPPPGGETQPPPGGGYVPPPYVPPPPPPPSDSGGEDFGEWYTRKPLAWVATGLLGVGLGVSIAFTAISADSLSVTNSIADQIRDQAAKDGITGSPCGNEEGANDVYPLQCKQARDANDIHGANQAVMIVGWVTTSLVAAGAVTYVMLDWYAGSRVGSATDANDGPRVGVMPAVSPDGAGAFVFGQF
jgi:hypothetical protein